MDEIEQHIKTWIRQVSEHRPELGGFAICPYALNAKFKIIICEEDGIVPVDGHDIVFFVLPDHLDLDAIQIIVENCNEKYKEWEFFEDCASYDTFVGGIKTNNGKYNLILAQPRAKLRMLREKLAKTGYYGHWDDDYLKEILKDDYDIIKK